MSLTGASGPSDTVEYLQGQFVKQTPLDYETVAASQTAQVLGNLGAQGDYLSHLVVVVATAASSAVTITDGSESAVTVFPNAPGAGIGTYTVPLGLSSRNGKWQVTTGAGSSVIAVGRFS